MVRKRLVGRSVAGLHTSSRPPGGRDAYAFDDRSHSAPAVRRLLELGHPEFQTASLNVSPDDDMYAFSVAATGATPVGAMAYFRAGASMIPLIDAIASWQFGESQRMRSVLDFAAGYGRSTRFLVKQFPAAEVTVSEIQTDALEFQAREFGVETLVSHTDPASLPTDKKFDLVFVASLFTHLPDATFGPWLAKLWELVSPGGVLVFSVHDEAINTMGVDLHDGFAFMPTTEVASLSTDDYGVNFTSVFYVQRQLQAVIGGDAEAAVRLPRALCFMQDVWIVPRGRRNSEPLEYECGPNGAVDLVQVDGRTMRAGGWSADTGLAAVSAVSHSISRIELHLAPKSRGFEREVIAALGLPRHDIAAYLGHADDPVLQGAGWTATGVARRRIRMTDIVSAVAVCQNGRRFVLDSSRVADIMTRTGNPPRRTRWQRRIRAARGVYRRAGWLGLARRVPRVVARGVRRRIARAATRPRAPR